jgi:hypothetical protein
VNGSAAGGPEVVDEQQPTRRAAPVPEWAPVDACALPTAEQPLREAEFTELFRTALRGMQRREPGRLRLFLAAEAEGSARDLVARESSCCSFFDFRLTTTDGALTLDVRVPEARIEVLDGLARRAGAARAGGGTGSGAIAAPRAPPGTA